MALIFVSCLLPVLMVGIYTFIVVKLLHKDLNALKSERIKK